MLGHYLLTLSEEQEDRVLTTAMRPGDYWAPCLVGIVLGAEASESGLRDICNRRWPLAMSDWVIKSVRGRSVENSFDTLCLRFGIHRITGAIRNRILSNRARRILGNASRETASVGECRFGRDS